MKIIYHDIYLPPMSPPFWRPSMYINSIGAGVGAGIGALAGAGADGGIGTGVGAVVVEFKRKKKNHNN